MPFERVASGAPVPFQRLAVLSQFSNPFGKLCCFFSHALDLSSSCSYFSNARIRYSRAACSFSPTFQILLTCVLLFAQVLCKSFSSGFEPVAHLPPVLSSASCSLLPFSHAIIHLEWYVPFSPMLVPFEKFSTFLIFIWNALTSLERPALRTCSSPFSSALLPVSQLVQLLSTSLFLLVKPLVPFEWFLEFGRLASLSQRF